MPRNALLIFRLAAGRRHFGGCFSHLIEYYSCGGREIWAAVSGHENGFTLFWQLFCWFWIFHSPCTRHTPALFSFSFSLSVYFPVWEKCLFYLHKWLSVLLNPDPAWRSKTHIVSETEKRAYWSSWEFPSNPWPGRFEAKRVPNIHEKMTITSLIIIILLRRNVSLSSSCVA